MSWTDIWRFIRSWEGIVPTVIAASAAIYYGPKKMLEVWDWYIYRFIDQDVLLMMKDRKIVPTTLVNGAYIKIAPTEAPYTASQIAEYLGRSEDSVIKSLKRLYAHDKVERYEYGWRLKT
jgi:hypothetical protein